MISLGGYRATYPPSTYKLKWAFLRSYDIQKTYIESLS